jgi:hypothetical protein
MRRKIKGLKDDIVTYYSANGMTRSFVDLYSLQRQKGHNEQNVIVIDPKSDFATLKSRMNNKNL